MLIKETAEVSESSAFLGGDITRGEIESITFVKDISGHSVSDSDVQFFREG